MTHFTEVNGYLISDDKTLLQPERIWDYLANESYWSRNIPLEVVKKAIAGSICFGIYHEGLQVGYARVITDGATFGYLADVYVLSAHRGQGLSKALMALIMQHPQLQGLRGFLLATLDAHGLYQQFGFRPLAEPARYMHIKFFEHY